MQNKFRYLTESINQLKTSHQIEYLTLILIQFLLIKV